MNEPEPTTPVWHVVLGGGGVQFHAGPLVKELELNRRVVVKRVSWTRPGFSRGGGDATGWALFVDGVQQGPAHRTATKAREHAELPGVWASVQKALTS